MRLRSRIQAHQPRDAAVGIMNQSMKWSVLLPITNLLTISSPVILWDEANSWNLLLYLCPLCSPSFPPIPASPLLTSTCCLLGSWLPPSPAYNTHLTLMQNGSATWTPWALKKPTKPSSDLLSNSMCITKIQLKAFKLCCASIPLAVPGELCRDLPHD